MDSDRQQASKPFHLPTGNDEYLWWFGNWCRREKQNWGWEQSFAQRRCSTPATSVRHEDTVVRTQRSKSWVPIRAHVSSGPKLGSGPPSPHSSYKAQIRKWRRRKSRCRKTADTANSHAVCTTQRSRTPQALSRLLHSSTKQLWSSSLKRGHRFDSSQRRRDDWDSRIPDYTIRVYGREDCPAVKVKSGFASALDCSSRAAQSR